MSELKLVPGLSRLLAGMSTPGSQDIDGWGRLGWGMAYDQVKTRYTQAVEDGPDLKITSTKGGQRKGWSLTFGFDDGRRLDSVTLRFEGGSELSDFSKISRELSARLGAPASTTQTSATWNQGGNTYVLSTEPGQGVVLSQSV